MRRKLLHGTPLVAMAMVLGCTISGTITDGSGEGMDGVEVSLSAVWGDTSLTTLTDANGFYEFLGLPFQSYFIRPALEGMFFRPAEKRVLAGRTRVDFTQDLGQWREYTRVFTLVEPVDVDLYASLLPQPLEMPEHPWIGVFIVDFVSVGPPLRPYLEGSIGLYCQFEGEEGWYALTMSVTDGIACFLGRLGEFKKYVADEIALSEIEDGWKGAVVHQGRIRVALEYTPDPTVDMRVLAGLKGTVYQFAPAGLDLYLNRITLVPVVPPAHTFEPGRVQVTIDPEAPWAGLFAEEAEGVGALETFQGGNNMVLEQVYWSWSR